MLWKLHEVRAVRILRRCCGEVLWNVANDARAPAGLYILAEHSRFEAIDLSADKRVCAVFNGPLPNTEVQGAGFGTPVTLASPSSVDECCQACTGGCTGFVLFGVTCYLKKGDLTTVTSQDRIGYLAPAPPPTIPLPSAPPRSA